MKISSAEFTKMTVQQVADMILDENCNGVSAIGFVDDQMYVMTVTLEVCEDDKKDSK